MLEIKSESTLCSQLSKFAVIAITLKGMNKDNRFYNSLAKGVKLRKKLNRLLPGKA